MWQDIRFGLRSLAKSPAFALVAILTIALGVGPNSAIFSIVNAVMLRPLPYPDSERLVMLWQTNRQRGLNTLPVSGATFSDWKRDSRSFESMAPAFTISEYGFNVTAGGEPERAQAGQATADFFSVLGLKPVAGRWFLPEEDAPGGTPVVLLGHGFWMRRFGGSSSVIGRSIGLDGVNRVVVGVLPKELDALVKVDLWIPIAKNLPLTPRDDHNFGIVARLKPGVSAAQAQAEMDGIAKRLEREYPATDAGMGVLVIRISDLVSGRIRPALMVLLAAVGFLLLIACANVANLLLARGAARDKELALRAAMGASRWRILRQLLTESVLLGTLGGALGLLLSAWSIGALRSELPDVIPRLKEMGVDGQVLLFSLAVSMLTGIIFGLAPALRASRADLNDALKAGGGKGVSGDASQRARTVLLVGEVALALVVLVGAGLLVRSFQRVISLDPGFRPENVLTMQLTLPQVKYHGDNQVIAFSRSILRRVESLPGVRSAGIINILPARGAIMNLRISATTFRPDDAPQAPAGQEPIADYREVTPGFFPAMGVTLTGGRIFTDQDGQGKQPVAIVNETLAKRYFPNQDPLGHRLRIPASSNDPALIVGVLGDMRMQTLEGQVEPAVFVPFEQDTTRRLSLVIRGGSDPAGLAAAVRREILAVDPDQPVSDVRTMNAVISDSLLVRRLAVWMLGTFAALALVLATVGIYGLTSYSVSRRTHEIGLRVALGAAPAEVLRLVIWRGIVTALVGIVVGVPGAVFLARLMGGMLFGISTTDAVTFLVVPAILVAAAAFASYMPARRALRIDPIVALRYE